MTKKDTLIAGIGIGIVTASFFARVFNEAMWFVLSLGILLLILGSTGVLSNKN